MGRADAIREGLSGRNWQRGAAGASTVRDGAMHYSLEVFSDTRAITSSPVTWAQPSAAGRISAPLQLVTDTFDYVYRQSHPLGSAVNLIE